MKQHTQARTLVILAGLAIIIVGFFGGKAVPIYDGVGFPDEPYRYVIPPTSQKAKTPPPSTALAQVSPADINNNLNGAYVSSQEQGPQVAINLSQNSLVTPSNAKTIEIKAEPLAPTAQPTDGSIVGNVYRLTITADAGTVRFSPPNSSNYKFIDLRLPQGSLASPVIEFRPTGGSWQRLETGQVGADIYEAKINNTGDFALVTPKQARAKVKSQLRARTILEVLAFMILAVMVAVVVDIRFNSGKRKNKK